VREGHSEDSSGPASSELDVRQDALAEEPDRLHDLVVGRPAGMGVA
jgi:hypothetical protein